MPRLLKRLGVNYKQGAPLFTPKKISGLALWLDASDLSTITKDGSNYVTQWNDKSGKGFNVAQGTGSAQPQWVSSEVVFDGSSDVLLSAGGLDLIKNKAGATVFAVAKITVATGTNLPFFTITINSGPATGASRLLLSTGTANGTVRTAGRRLDADTLDGPADEAYTLNQRYIFTGINDYTNAKAYLYFNNALKQTDNTFQTAGASSDTTSNGFSIGGNYVATIFCKVNISEVIVYESALSTNDIAKVSRYLANKWGVTI